MAVQGSLIIFVFEALSRFHCWLVGVFAGWPRMCADWHVPPIPFLLQFIRVTYIRVHMCINPCASSSVSAYYNRPSAVCRPLHSLHALTRLKSKSHWKNDMRWRLKWNPMSRVKWRKKQGKNIKACRRMRWTTDSWLLRRRACTLQAAKQSIRVVYFICCGLFNKLCE